MTRALSVWMLMVVSCGGLPGAEPEFGPGIRPVGDWFGKKPATPSDDPNIIGVRKFVSQEPWLSFNRDGVRRVDGFKATIYLESGTSGRGAFGDGTVRITLYSVETRPDKTERLRREHRWDLAPKDTLPWRTKQASRLGWAYGLRLKWAETVNVAGKEVELSFQFVRKDGQVISAEPIRLRVPLLATRVVDDGMVNAPPPARTPPAAPNPPPPKYPPPRR